MKLHQEYSYEIGIFKTNGGTLQTSKALAQGIHPRDLYQMKDKGIIESVARGLYRLSDAPPPSNPDLLTVGLKIPQGVICLISALSFHGITTHIPRRVDIALHAGAKKPALAHPPIHCYWFSGPTFSDGIETHRIDNVSVKIYSAEKTVADCFKFRNKVGLDVAIEALKFYWEEKKSTVDTLLKFAKVCRVDKIMQPYLEAIQ